MLKETHLILCQNGLMMIEAMFIIGTLLSYEHRVEKTKHHIN